MSRTGTPKGEIERYMTYYNCSYAEAKLRVERGDPLPPRGTRVGRTAVVTSENTTLIANVLGVLGAIFGSISILIRLFEKKEEP